MTTAHTRISTHASGSYAALRHGGEPPWRAQAQLGLDPRAAARLERQFQRRGAAGPDRMKPRFARHDEHVAAIAALGGYPVCERRR